MPKFLIFNFLLLPFVTFGYSEKIDTFLPPNFGGRFNVYNTYWDSFFQKNPCEASHFEKIKSLQSFKYRLNDSISRDFFARKIDFYLEALPVNDFEMNFRNDFEFYTKKTKKEQFVAFLGCYSPCKYGSDLLFFDFKKGQIYEIEIEKRLGNWLIDSLYFGKKSKLITTQCSSDNYGNFKRYYYLSKNENKVVDMFIEDNPIPIPILEFFLKQYMNENGQDYKSLDYQMINPRNFVFSEVKLEKIKKNKSKYHYFIDCPILRRKQWEIVYDFKRLELNLTN